MELLTISDIKRAAAAGRVEARLHAQVDAVALKQTREGKPYYELTLADAAGRLSLKAWNDSLNFNICEALRKGDFVEIEGEFLQHPAFGLDARRWESRPLLQEETALLLEGPPALREKQARDYANIGKLLDSLQDPRLHGVCQLFLAVFGDRFRRAAAARTYHHARRGGLVEHVAQMMRLAESVAAIYPALNRDLLLAGTFFHDVGKLWENCPEPNGFGIPYDERGELIGHITIGIEMFNALWRKLLCGEEAQEWREITPSNEDVRNHLIHMIAAHHGEMAFGSPVFPKTPEAYALHFIDNLDAKLEMVFNAYGSGNPLAERITERVRPLSANLVKPLAKYPASAEVEGADPF